MVISLLFSRVSIAQYTKPDISQFSMIQFSPYVGVENGLTLIPPTVSLSEYCVEALFGSYPILKSCHTRDGPLSLRLRITVDEQGGVLQGSISKRNISELYHPNLCVFEKIINGSAFPGRLGFILILVHSGLPCKITPAFTVSGREYGEVSKSRLISASMQMTLPACALSNAAANAFASDTKVLHGKSVVWEVIGFTLTIKHTVSKM